MEIRKINGKTVRFYSPQEVADKVPVEKRLAKSRDKSDEFHLPQKGTFKSMSVGAGNMSSL